MNDKSKWSAHEPEFANSIRVHEVKHISNRSVVDTLLKVIARQSSERLLLIDEIQNLKRENAKLTGIKVYDHLVS